MTLADFLSMVGGIQEYSRRSKLLLFAYFLRQYENVFEFAPIDIRRCFQGAALKVPSDLSELLRGLSRGRNSPLMTGARRGTYALALPGMNEVETYLGPRVRPEAEVDALLKSAIPYLEKVIAKLSNGNQKQFIAEAIACLGVDAKRATVVMTWACTISHLYDHIVAKKPRLDAFNSALRRRSDRYAKLTISAYDDFGDIPESIFIEVCRSAKLVSNDVRKILDEKLGIRNTCAHPSAVEIHKTKVVNFIEDLVDNVLTKYPSK
ncbi:MAG: hypothetical protein ABFE13_12715 [Phycisphaerales bacterium]